MGKRRSAASQDLGRRVQLAFGGLLKQAREDSKPRLSQAEVAEALGISRTSVSNIENGRHRVFLDQVYAAARALRVSPVRLLPDEAALSPSPNIHASSGAEIDASQLKALGPVVAAAHKKTRALAKSETKRANNASTDSRR